jgi:hypothetical protein
MTRRGSAVLLGSALMAVAISAGCSSAAAVQLDSYRTGADDRHITVSVTIGEHDSIAGVKTKEDPTKVTVDLRVNRAGGTGTDVGVIHNVDVTLTDPLADRLVVDGTGRTVPKMQ